MTALWAVLAALPFGWGFGLFAARIIMPGDIGQLPALTIPICIVSGLIFAILPIVNARIRLNILLIGAALGFALDPLLPR